MPIERARYFECNFPVTELKSITKRGYSKKYAEDNGIDYRDMSVTGKSRRKGSIDVWRKVMDMHWPKRGWELTEAIPPAYTKYIGEQILKYENKEYGI